MFTFWGIINMMDRNYLTTTAMIDWSIVLIIVLTYGYMTNEWVRELVKDIINWTKRVVLRKKESV